jgi:glycosyltransferase involved in cell wall biosynthesis
MEPEKTAQLPLRILMACGVPRRREGGVAATVYNLGREMERSGHQVTYLFQEDLLEPGGVPARFAEVVFSLRLGQFIASNRSKFSIVNLHAPVGFAYGLRRRLNRAGNLPPYVMTLHGLEERRVYVMKREAKKGRAWNFAWKNRVWQRLYHQPRFNWSISSADGAMVFARDTATILQLKYDVDADRVAVIPPGVESRFVMPREYRDDGALRILFVGTWLDQRGIYYLREALNNLRRLPGWTMTFAGCGVPEGEIRTFFGDDLADRILVRGTTPTADMPKLYAEHDVLLFPSLLEGLPLAVLEAMASGMPVITTDTCGMPDVVQDGINGLLIPPASTEGIEKAFIRLAESKGFREQLGRAAQESMRHYTWERSAKQLEGFFGHILELAAGESR